MYLVVGIAASRIPAELQSTAVVQYFEVEEKQVCAGKRKDRFSLVFGRRGFAAKRQGVESITRIWLQRKRERERQRRGPDPVYSPALLFFHLFIGNKETLKAHVENQSPQYVISYQYVFVFRLCLADVRRIPPPPPPLCATWRGTE